jgi:hypothetical protein
MENKNSKKSEGFMGITNHWLVVAGLVVLLIGLGLVIFFANSNSRENRKLAKGVKGKVKLEYSASGVLKGMIRFEGTSKERDVVLGTAVHKNRVSKDCLGVNEKEVNDQSWLINSKNNGLANVLVFLRAPKDRYFDIHPSEQVRKTTAAIQIDHCVFIPPVIGVFPKYYDGKEWIETGEQFKIINNSRLDHAIVGLEDSFGAPAIHFFIAPGTFRTYHLTPQNHPFEIKCNIHYWMVGYVWAFDHPFFSFSKADGSFEISGVPAGPEVEVVVWHQRAGYILGENGKRKKFHEGENALNISVKPP